MDKIDQLLERRVDKIYPSKEALEKALRSGRKLRLYLGIDPTGVRLHLGHTIPLLKLQEFADLGHEAILLFGTGTVLVGDPSQREKRRKPITEKEIKKNIATWRDQIKKIIDFKKIKIKKNADWLLKLTSKEIIEIASKITAIQLFKREMFQRRLEKGDTVWFHETLYPLLQGFDSVAMNVDLEIGGTDQTFNMLIGRELMQKMKNKEKFVLTTPMILGINGKPMSKTSGNCVWLEDEPSKMYGKIMSIPDNLIDSYFELLTDADLKKLKLQRLSPMNLKKKLAFEIVKKFNSKESAKKAESFFERVVQKRKTPKEVPVVMVEYSRGQMVNIIDLLIKTKLISSRSKAKRLVGQEAVKINGKKIPGIKHQVLVKNGMVIKAGRRRFTRILLKQPLKS